MLYSPADNMSAAEPKVVVAHREDLWWLLAEACQLEHMIMCQYLFAEWTLKDKGDGLTDEQSEAVERWRGVLRGIAIEEMLHLALVANVMSSIGAAPYFGRPNFPQRSGYFPASIQLDLMPFGEQALKHFLFLERPEGMERQDAEGFVPTAPRRDPLSESEAMPRGQEFLTVGHLYRGIEDGLTRLTHELGERALFVGSPRAQATPEMFRWPQVVAVTDLDSALRAVGEIIEQGEGARGHWEDAHYGRFLWDLGRVPRAPQRRPGFRAGTPRGGGLHPPAVRPQGSRHGDHEPRGPSRRGSHHDRLRGAPPPLDPVLHPHRRDRRATRPADERGD